MPCKHIKPLNGERKFEAWLNRQTNKQTNNTQFGVRMRVVNKTYRPFYPWQGISPVSHNFLMAPFVLKKKSWGCSLPFSGNLGSVTRTRRLVVVKKSALKVVFNIFPIRASKRCFYYSDKRLWGIVITKKISLNKPPNNKFSGLLNLGVVKMTDLYCGYSPPLSRTSVAVWSWLDNFTVFSVHKL